MARSLKARVEYLERAIPSALMSATDRLAEKLPLQSRRALAAFVAAELGVGPPVDGPTRRLARRAANKVWDEATERERRLLWGAVPLPRLWR